MSSPGRDDGEARGSPADVLPTDGLDARGDGYVLVRRFRLVVASGDDAGTTFRSEGTRAVIGSHESADLVLHDRAVSRLHAQITLAEGRALIEDLGSRNGVQVDGVTVLQAFLGSGSRITVGRTEVRFDLGDDHASVPLSSRERFGLLVGRSPAMRATFALLERAAGSDSTVLLAGETGTGKEAAAESIHRESARRDGPFVVIDCSAIPADLLESELFGHERGAFTGAVTAREGAFEAASGGTLFLDEIGELAPSLQPKLLRCLERREVKHVGSNEHLPVDVRILAATNRELREAVNDGGFRSDLYYRLAVVEVTLPPLRGRREDLPLLVAHLLEALGANGTPEAAALETDDFLQRLGRHSWPGNVRELRNYLERCLVMREQRPIEPARVSDPPTVDIAQPLKAARQRWVMAFERRYLEAILRAEHGNVSAAARAAGVDRIHFYRLLWKHGLR